MTCATVQQRTVLLVGTSRTVAQRYKSNRTVGAYVVEQWHRSWATCSNGSQYRQIEPDVGRRVKYTCNTRRKEVTATRLRLGKCSLNAYLYEIHAHPDGSGLAHL